MSILSYAHTRLRPETPTERCKDDLQPPFILHAGRLVRGAGFQREPWIRTCIESILVDPDAEVIAVDDGSEDRSLQVLETLRKRNPSRITVLSQRNEGPAAARNRGAIAARGKWIWFVDADDFLVRGALPTVRQVLTRTDCDALAVGMSEFRFFRTAIPPLPSRVTARPSDPASALFAFSSGAPRTIVKKELWTKAMRANEVSENVWAEDNISFSRLMLEAKTVWQLPARVYARRRHYDSRSGLSVHMSSFAAKTSPHLLEKMAELRTSVPSALSEALEWRIARVAEYVSSASSMTLCANRKAGQQNEEVALAREAALRVLSSIPDCENSSVLVATVSDWLKKAAVQTATEAKIARFRILHVMRSAREMARELISSVASILSWTRSGRNISVHLSQTSFVLSLESVAKTAKSELQTAKRIARLFGIK